MIVRLGREGDRHRPAARLHRRGVPVADRPRARSPCIGEGRRGERAAVPTRPARSRAFVFKTRLGPVRRAHHDVPGVQREGPARLHRAQRHPGHRRADRPALHAAGQGARRRCSEVAAGDIGAVAKLQHAHTGDTFSTKDDPVHAAAARRCPSRCSPTRSRPKTKGDEDKLATGLARLREEDPTLRVSRNEETHETVMHGMGEAHLEVHDRAPEAQVRRRGRRPRPRRSRTARRSAARRRALGRHVKQTRRPRPVRGLQHRDRAARPAARASSTRTRSSAARSRTSSSRRSRRAS